MNNTKIYLYLYLYLLCSIEFENAPREEKLIGNTRYDGDYINMLTLHQCPNAAFVDTDPLFLCFWMIIMLVFIYNLH